MSSMRSTVVCGVGTQITSLPGWPTSGVYSGLAVSLFGASVLGASVFGGSAAGASVFGGSAFGASVAGCASAKPEASSNARRETVAD